MAFNRFIKFYLDASFLFEPANLNDAMVEGPSSCDDEELIALGDGSDEEDQSDELMEDGERPFSPATMLREERLLARPELGPYRLAPRADTEDECHFLAVPTKGDIDPSSKGVFYGKAVTLNNRFNVIQPEGLLRTPTDCKFNSLNFLFILL